MESRDKTIVFRTLHGAIACAAAYRQQGPCAGCFDAPLAGDRLHAGVDGKDRSMRLSSLAVAAGFLVLLGGRRAARRRKLTAGRPREATAPPPAPPAPPQAPARYTFNRVDG